METERIAGLTAEIKGQLWLMQKVSGRISSEASAISSGTLTVRGSNPLSYRQPSADLWLATP